MLNYSFCSEELSEDVAKDASVHEVGNFGVRIKTALYFECSA